MNAPLVSGLVPAVFTPMEANGSLALERVAPIVERLVGERIGGLYVCGSTGEGPSLSREERIATVEAYVSAARGRVPVIVQVGHASLAEARLLAEHAKAEGADAISAVPPSYFKPASLAVLVDCLAEISGAAPGLPFYYYHIPRMTAVEVDVVELLHLAAERVPAFTGVKYSAFTVFELQACVNAADGRFNMLFGADEMLLAGIAAGADGAVGSTYNFAAPLYNRVLDAFARGDMEAARLEQGRAVEMVRVLQRFDANPAIKAMMTLIGEDCGGTRLPQRALGPEEQARLREMMAAIGFFDWGRC